MKVYVKATKYLKGMVFNTKADEFFKTASGLSLYGDRNADNQVYLTKEDTRIAVYLNKTRVEDDLLAKIQEEDNKGGDKPFEEEEILFASYNELLFLDLTRCVSYVVGRSGRSLIIEVEEKENVEEALEEEAAVMNTSTKDAILTSGVLSEAELTERCVYLKSQGIKETDPIFSLYLSAIRRQDENIKKPETTYKGVGTKASKTLIRKMLMHIVCGHHLVLQGHKSTGKNVAWETVAWLLNCQLVSLTCSKRMTTADIFGHASTDDTLKDGINNEGAYAYIMATTNAEYEGYKYYDEAAEFVKKVSCAMSPSLVLSPGQITKAMMLANEGLGVILLLNEMNYADPNTLASAINDLIDGHTDYMYITDMGNVPISKDLIVGATQNSLGGEYVGTQQQNGALMSRLDCIILDKVPDIMPLLKQAKPIYKVDEATYEVLNKIYKEFLELVETGSVSEGSINVRGFKRAVEVISLGYEIKDAVSECVINTVQNNDELELLEEAMDNQVA